LLVEVTHSQKDSQVDAPCWRERVEAIVLKKGYVVVRGTPIIVFQPYPPRLV